MSLHILIGVGLLYYMAALFVNTTYVVVDHYNLTIEHRPLKMPFYPGRTIPSRDIDQIYIHKYVASRTNGQPNYAFGVQALLKTGENIKLLKGLRNANQAQYIEQEIEKFLKIKDRAVEEEFKG